MVSARTLPGIPGLEKSRAMVAEPLRLQDSSAPGVAGHTSPPVTFNYAERDGSGRQIVAMMQAAESRHRDDFGSDRRAFCPLSACRSLLLQPEMRSVIVVVTNVFGHEPFQMALIQARSHGRADRDGSCRRSAQQRHFARGF